MELERLFKMSEAVRDAVLQATGTAGLDPLYGTAIARLLSVLVVDYCGFVERDGQPGEVSPMDVINLWLSMTLEPAAVNRFLKSAGGIEGMAERHHGVTPDPVVHELDGLHCSVCSVLLTQMKVLPPLLECWRCGAYLKSEEAP